jgi:hypothetical protein
MNCKVRTGRVVVASDSDTVTRELQEKRSEIPVATTGPLFNIDSDARRTIPATAVPHTGQLNITTSTVSTRE